MNALEGSVLIVDDDPAVGKVLGALLRQDGLGAEHVQTGARALDLLESRPVDLVVADIRMPGMDGMQLLEQVAARWPELPVVMLTAHGTIQLAVEAMKLGAADFLLKPFDREEIVYVVRKALRLSAQARDAAPRPLPSASVLIGESAAMREIHVTLRRAARTNATVLVRGETGTGKGLVARAIHQQSGRAAGPFISVQCAALPDALLESELFGYEKGAFTGAAARKPGRVELAQGGTLFLDEIGDITPMMQVKLLRLLQEREYDRLGGTQTLKADVRFVAATNCNLEAMIESGRFREDLFYRLSVVPIWLPPLRERPDDIERLARHFSASSARANGMREPALDDTAIAALRGHSWRGNARELQNFVERLLVLTDGAKIGAPDVRRELARQPSIGPAGAELATTAGNPIMHARIQAAEREALAHALSRAGNNRTVAARILGIGRRTLYAKLHEHGLL